MTHQKTEKFHRWLRRITLILWGVAGVIVAALMTFLSTFMKSCLDETLSDTPVLCIIQPVSFMLITLIFFQANRLMKNFYHAHFYPIFMMTEKQKTRERIDVCCTMGISLLLVVGYSASLSVIPLWFKISAIVLLSGYFIANVLKIALLARVWRQLMKRCGRKPSCD